MERVKDGATAIIMSPDKVLLFHRDNIPTIPYPDCWQSVGGGIEEGETPEQGLLREVKEEVSFDLSNYQLLASRIGGFGETVSMYVSFVNKDKESKCSLGPDEGQEIGWFTLDEVTKLKLTDSSKLMYVDFRPFLEEIMTTRRIDPEKTAQIIKAYEDKFKNKL